MALSTTTEPATFLDLADFDPEMIAALLRQQLKGLEDHGVVPSEPELSSEPKYSSFNAYLLFISGPGTNNLVLSFFLSNRKKKFSREDVFAHLNRHCEEQGIREFFVDHLGYEFTAGTKADLKLGRSTVLRTISNLEKLGLLEKVVRPGSMGSVSNKRAKYRLARNGKTDSLCEMMDAWSDDEDYKKFIKFRNQREIKRGRPVKVNTFEGLVWDYIDDLSGYDFKRKRKSLFRTRLSRLSYYCEAEGENYSTLNRVWFEVMKDCLHEFKNDDLFTICKHLGYTSSSNLGKKNKNDLVKLVIKQITEQSL